jgi:hypothetical protein
MDIVLAWNGQSRKNWQHWVTKLATLGKQTGNIG